MPLNAFVYGTLMSEEVVKLLLKRVPPMRPATLKGYQRFKVREQVFPAIVSNPDTQVQGQVLQSLSKSEMEILDAYETDEYKRVTVKPIFEDGSTTEAEVYVWIDDLRHLLEEEAWDYGEFRKLHLEEYTKDTLEFIQSDLLEMWNALPDGEQPNRSS